MASHPPAATARRSWRRTDARLIAAFAALSTLAGAGLALAADPPPAPPPSRSAAAAAPPSQPIDPRHSSASFVVTLRLRGPAEGRLPGVTGDLQGAAATGWRVHVRLDAQGLRFNGPRWMERATRSPAFLSVDRYPSIRFESDPFDDARLHAGGVLRGQLTLRGQRRDVAFELLPSTCARPGRDCDIRVQGAVDRRDFGMVAHRAMVLDRVELHIRVRLRGAPP